MTSGPQEYLHYFTQLLFIAQMLHGQTQGVDDHLCLEVAKITQGQAQLVLHHQGSPERAEALSSATSFSFPVQFRNQIYGTLHVASNPMPPPSPALSRILAYLLAQICGFILYTLEVSALLQQQLPQISYDTQKTLTKREREVLTLMCHGYGQQAIAEKLNITPKTVAKHREHIYEHLGIHRESEVLLVAYLVGLYSPLEKTTN